MQATTAERAQRNAFSLIVATPDVVGGLKLAAIVELAHFELMRWKRRAARTEHFVEQLLPLRVSEVAANDVVVQPIAKALLAEIVGNPVLCQHF